MRKRRIAAFVLLFGLAFLAASAGRAAAEKAKDIPPLDSKTRKRITALIDEYFAASDITEELRLLNKLRKFDPVSPRDLKRFVKYAWKKVKEKGALPKPRGTQKVDSPFGSTTVILSGKPSRKGGGLLLGLHGGGPNAGDASEPAGNWPAPKGFIGVYPNAIERVWNSWNQPKQEHFLQWLVKLVRRSVQLDSNRVYVAGHSMGGHGAYGQLLQYADVFAAGVASAGNPLVEDSADHYGDAKKLADNLYNTAIYVVHSEDDPKVAWKPVKEWTDVLAALHKKFPGGYDYHFSFYKKNGHGLAVEGTAKCLEWACRHVRDPRPKVIRWRMYRPWKRHFYWLYADKPVKLALVEARYTAPNEVEITGEDFMGRLSVLFNDKLVDMSKPVRVKANGRVVFEGVLQPSLSAAVCSIRENEDPEMVYTARVTIEMP